MSLSEAELRDLAQAARSATAEASALVGKGFRSGGRVSKKGALDLVTEYDFRSEALLRERIEKLFPQHQFVGEEGEAKAIENDFVWYVDPIDGTTNFAHGHPCFAVSVALAYRGEPVVGVVSGPALGVEWWAASGLGCYRNDERVYVSSAKSIDESLLATGFAYDVRSEPDDNFSEFSRLYRISQGIRRCGAAALDLAFVADGAFDGYWEQRLKSWDIAAGVLLVAEAGGRVTNYAGHPIGVDPSHVVASNGLVHDELLAEIAAARKAGGLASR